MHILLSASIGLVVLIQCQYICQGKNNVACYIGTLVIEIAEKTYGTSTYKKPDLQQDLNYTHCKPHTWISIRTFTHNLKSTVTGKVYYISGRSPYNDAVCTTFMHINKLNTMWTACAFKATCT